MPLALVPQFLSHILHACHHLPAQPGICFEFHCGKHSFSIIYWSDADNAFIIEVPELSGCFTNGSTLVQRFVNPRNRKHTKKPPGVTNTERL